MISARICAHHIRMGGGNNNWRYTLFQLAKTGDIVFHYDKRASAITAVSRIAGPPVDKPIIWAAHGSHARKRHAVPTELPGYRIPLAHHQRLTQPLTLETIRLQRQAIVDIYDSINLHGPRYFPFELSDRPIRPLQGYAFKLPARFVSAFPTLQAAANALPQTSNMSSEVDTFHQAIEAIERAAPDYEISGLQSLRARNRGLKRIERSIFGTRRHADNWAIHFGGRRELQFNVGVDRLPDGTPSFRAGVAFSFEPSRSLPSIDILVPKVARFNACLREYPKTFAGLTMWHWQDGERSGDYYALPINQNLVRNGTFVFLGINQPLASVDPHLALRTFDRLLPLYEWVESGGQDTPQPLTGEEKSEDSISHDRLQLNGGTHIDGGQWVRATRRERTLDIYLRHKEMQRLLKETLIAEGFTEVALEVPIGYRSIDLVARHGEELWFYEIKTSATVRGCIREAIGQLLEYALWPGATQPAHMVVVGEPTLDSMANQYLSRLKKKVSGADSLSATASRSVNKIFPPSPVGRLSRGHLYTLTARLRAAARAGLSLP